MTQFHPRPAIVSLFRIVVSLLFICHGARTMFGVLGGRTAAVGAWPTWWAALIQLLAGALVLVGLFTVPAALLCSGSMAYAYFSVHQPKALWPIQNGGEAAAMFCWAFLMIAAIGAGPWALDALRRRRAEAPGPGRSLTAATIGD